MYVWIAILGLFHFGIRRITIFECFDGCKGFLISISGQLDYILVMMLAKWTVEVCLDQKLEVEKEVIEHQMNLSSSFEEKNDIQRHSSGVVGDVKENDSYSFYQVTYELWQLVLDLCSVSHVSCIAS